MKDATLKQAGKLLSIFDRMSSEKFQALIASGLLIDLRDADIWTINRDDFREFLAKSTPAFTYDKTKDGWKLVENVTEAMEFKIKDLELVSFLRGGESYINGEEMVRRAKELKINFGQQQAEYLLANQDQIPKEFRKHYLPFPGTVWQGPNGNRFVPYLRWGGGQR